MVREVGRVICSADGRAGTRRVWTGWVLVRSSLVLLPGCGRGRTLWRGPGAVIIEGEIELVVDGSGGSQDADLRGDCIVGVGQAGDQSKNMTSLQTSWQRWARACSDAVIGIGHYC